MIKQNLFTFKKYSLLIGISNNEKFKNKNSFAKLVNNYSTRKPTNIIFLSTCHFYI